MENSSQLNFPGTLHKSEDPFSPSSPVPLSERGRRGEDKPLPVLEPCRYSSQQISVMNYPDSVKYLYA